MSSFKCSTVFGTSADILGNVRKSSESRRKFSEVAGTFPEIPALPRSKSHTFDAENSQRKLASIEFVSSAL